MASGGECVKQVGDGDDASLDGDIRTAQTFGIPLTVLFFVMSQGDAGGQIEQAAARLLRPDNPGADLGMGAHHRHLRGLGRLISAEALRSTSLFA
jgi:hypothetical protein